MEALKQRIMKEGTAVGSDRINVDGFLNHKIDTRFLDEIGLEIARRFAGVKIDKILTVEASGIAIAIAAAKYFGYVPVVFAKKAKPNTMISDCYEAKAFSFTKNEERTLTVSKQHLSAGEDVLIVDDFLAHGEASMALCEIAKAAGANVKGVGVVICKEQQGGKARLEEAGCRVEALALVKSLENGVIKFA
ncbi:MAG: xanthine phosphoribosyltransferase [Lachnospiraceae bacterium]|nr:xanthine phosphoribosyltransferase [Lachnospiraceae bacterium]